MDKSQEERLKELLEMKLEKHKKLYQLTNHSKQKAKHLADIRFWEAVFHDAKKEYKW